ncbi:MAG: hypothetical protein VX684_09940, partial [Planctomycetota bacterium]|nr:hypothetical protein [Planctomycetota bacterium]
MRIVRTRIPLFFYRRLGLIAVVGLVASTLLGARLLELTVLDGAELRLRAERMIKRESLLPSWRGAIVDRTGVVLAEDRASWSLAVPFPVLTGRWAREQAIRQSVAELGGEAWSALGPEEQAEAILQRIPAWNDLVEELLEGLAAQLSLDRGVFDERLESIRQSVSRMAARVHDLQEARYREQRLEQGLDGEREFRRRPIAEQIQSHVVATGIDDRTAFTLRRYAQAVAARATDRLGGRDVATEELLELVDGQQRNRPGATATVTIDRAGFPRPLRSEEPARLLLAG